MMLGTSGTGSARAVLPPRPLPVFQSALVAQVALASALDAPELQVLSVTAGSCGATGSSATSRCRLLLAQPGKLFSRDD